jgi:hypothetical protein
MLSKVISGGQTGVDQAALRSARAAGIPTGGFAAKGWQTEDGPAPWLADFGLEQFKSGGYAVRTRANVAISDGTLLLSDRELSGGSLLTFKECKRAGVTRLVVFLKPPPRSARALDAAARAFAEQTAAWMVAVADAGEWVRGHGVKVLNVAGPRESKAPGIGSLAEAFLGDLFDNLKRGDTP